MNPISLYFKLYSHFYERLLNTRHKWKKTDQPEVRGSGMNKEQPGVAPLDCSIDLNQVKANTQTWKGHYQTRKL